MAKVVAGMTMSLDGFIQERDGSVSRLYPDFDALVQSEVLQESMRETGAVVMGRRSYDQANGDFTGYEYQVPIFVLTHRVPETVAKGENDKLRLNFVTDGVESAMQQAKAAAGERNVTVVGGADTIQQLLNAGLVDELQIDIMPVLLGDGVRLFEHLDAQKIQLQKKRLVEVGERTSFWFRVVR